MANELSMLFDYEYDKVHLKVDESYHADGTVMGTNIYLFVHYPGEEPIKVSYKVLHAKSPGSLPGFCVYLQEAAAVSLLPIA